jgi:micrococcal nuclease
MKNRTTGLAVAVHVGPGKMAQRMNNRKFLFLITCAIFILGSMPAPSHSSPALQIARVHQVYDGDTVMLRLKDKKYKTRLIGIDAPEMRQRPWGRKAKEHLIEIMRRTGWTVYVETDVERQDKYGRLLAYLWTKKRALINEKMIVDGFATAFTIEPNSKYAQRFENAENNARDREKGIWGPKGLKERPVEWRKKHPRKDQEGK